MPIAFFRIANGIWFNNNIQVYIRIEGWNVDFPVFYKGEWGKNYGFFPIFFNKIISDKTPKKN